MFRRLPARPNLEHLRNQAKALLPEVRKRDAQAQLADAQHAVARNYGFASWPKLKAYVLAQADRGAELETALPSEADHPFAGTWIANLAESRPHPLTPFQSATVRFAISGDLMTIDQSLVDTTGKTDQVRLTIQTDGIEHAPQGGNGYSIVATWRGPWVLETLARKDGAIVGKGQYEVSADGQSLVLTDFTNDCMVRFDRPESALKE